MARRIAGRAAVAVVPAVLIVLGVVAFAATGGTTRLSLLGARPFHATRVVGQDFPKRLVDPSGIPQTLAAPPNRILSGVLASDEILTALVPPERLVAVTYLVDEPGLSDVAKLLPPDLAAHPRRGRKHAGLAARPGGAGQLHAGHHGAPAGGGGYSGGALSVVPLVCRHHELDPHAGCRGGGGRQRCAARRRHAAAHRRGGRTDAGLGAAARAVLRRGRLLGRPGHPHRRHDHPGWRAQRGAGRGSARTGTVAPGGCRQPAARGDPGFGVGAENGRRMAPRRFCITRSGPTCRPSGTGRVYGIKGAWLSSVSHYSVKALEAIARVLHPEAFSL